MKSRDDEIDDLLDKADRLAETNPSKSEKLADKVLDLILDGPEERAEEKQLLKTMSKKNIVNCMDIIKQILTREDLEFKITITTLAVDVNK